MKPKLHFVILNPLLLISLILLALSITVFAQSSNVTLIGKYPFGSCYAAFAYGNYVCVSNGTCLDVLDVSDPYNPNRVGRLITEDIIGFIFISGDYAYIANWSDGLRVVDISDPTDPTEVASIEFEGRCWDVSVFGDYAYVGNDTLGMRIVDISDPTSPTPKGTFDPPGTVTIEYIQVIDTLAYVASSSGLFIVNMSDPVSPTQVSFIPGYGSYHVNVANNVAYLSEFGYGLHLVDVTDPNNPVDLNYFDTPGSAKFFEVSGNYGYVADGSAGLYVLDMTNPISPDSVTVLNTDDATCFNIQGNYLYLADGSVGFKIVDINEPTLPTLKGSYDVGGYQFDVYASYSKGLLFAAQGNRGLGILDLSNQNPPIEIANLDMDNATVLCSSGDYVYVVGNGSLHIIDVSIPSSPQGVYLWNQGWVIGVYVSGNYAYLAGYPNLTILDISNPESPVWVGEFDGLPGGSFDVFVSGNYAYLSNGPNGLRIVNISDPGSLWEEGYFENVNNIYGVYISGNYAYLPDRMDDSLRIVDVSDPSAPSQVSSIYVEEARDVHVSGDYAYVVGSWTGVRVIDISDPSNPSEAGFFNTKGYTQKVYFDNYIYVANSAGGIYILENDLDPAGITNVNTSPISFSLSENFPNPFNPSTIIRYQIPELSFVIVKVFDVLGGEVATLVNEEKPAGTYELTWNAVNLPSGVYFYQLRAGDFIQTRKMILLK